MIPIDGLVVNLSGIQRSYKRFPGSIGPGLVVHLFDLLGGPPPSPLPRLKTIAEGPKRGGGKNLTPMGWWLIYLASNGGINGSLVQ